MTCDIWIYKQTNREDFYEIAVNHAHITMKNHFRDRSSLNANRGFLLLHSAGSAPPDSEIDVPIIYTDYYFLEALLKKVKLEKENNAVLYAFCLSG